MFCTPITSRKRVTARDSEKSNYKHLGASRYLTLKYWNASTSGYPNTPPGSFGNDAVTPERPFPSLAQGRLVYWGAPAPNPFSAAFLTCKRRGCGEGVEERPSLPTPTGRGSSRFRGSERRCQAAFVCPTWPVPHQPMGTRTSERSPYMAMFSAGERGPAPPGYKRGGAGVGTVSLSRRQRI